MEDIVLLSRVWNFAAQRHSTQRRKGKAQEPYVNHLAEVAELVATATKGQDTNLVAAAVLHDTVEDTGTLLAELASVFNADIANLVAEVTDVKRLDKAERKKLQVEHASAKSERAKIIKLADKTSNLRALVKSPPDDWSVQRRQEYLGWALEVVEGLRGANPWLEAQFDEAVLQLAVACEKNAQLTAKQSEMEVKWKTDGSVCPICSGEGRGSTRYPGALCEACQELVVDINGNRVELYNQNMSGGLLIKTLENEMVGSPEEMPLFCSGVECRAREHRFGGVVVQPVRAWQAPYLQPTVGTSQK
jgi:GTP diphosphokinase / guanosine-3',5'-bis(diphosphate) 3'-diphosphatase